MIVYKTVYIGEIGKHITVKVESLFLYCMSLYIKKTFFFFFCQFESQRESKCSAYLLHKNG